MFKKCSILLGIFFLGFLVIQSFQTIENPSKNILIVGLQSGYPPF